MMWYNIPYFYVSMRSEMDTCMAVLSGEGGRILMKREMPDLRSFMDQVFSKPQETAPETDSPKVRLGTNQKTGEPIFWMPWEPSQMHGCVLGAPGTGKTQLIKSVIVQILRQYPNMGILVLDFKGDYNETKPEFVEVTRAKVRKIHHLSLNPFELRHLEHIPQLHVHTAMAFAEAMGSSYSLDPIQKSTLVQSVMTAYAHCGITEDPETWSLPAPTFGHVFREYLDRPTSQHNDSLVHILENLAGQELFEGNQEDNFDGYANFRGVVVLDLSGYSDPVKKLVAMLILSKFCDRMSGSEAVQGLEKLVLVDEADDILSHGCPVLSRMIREGKERGVGILLSARYPDFLKSLGFDGREYIHLWLVHHVEELRKSELEHILRAEPYDPRVEQLYQFLRRLERDECVLRLGREEPVRMENLPFHDISTDTAQTYLRQSAPEPEEDIFAGMPELDVTHLEAFDLDEDIQLETLDIFEELL